MPAKPDAPIPFWKEDYSLYIPADLPFYLSRHVRDPFPLFSHAHIGFELAAVLAGAGPYFARENHIPSRPAIATFLTVRSPTASARARAWISFSRWCRPMRFCRFSRGGRRSGPRSVHRHPPWQCEESSITRNCNRSAVNEGAPSPDAAALVKLHRDVPEQQMRGQVPELPQSEIDR